jgi:hypothetical protein
LLVVVGDSRMYQFLLCFEEYSLACNCGIIRNILYGGEGSGELGGWEPHGRRRLSGKRHSEKESTSLALHAAHPDSSSMCLNELFTYVQSETHPF